MPLSAQQMYLDRLPARQAEWMLFLSPLPSLPFMEARAKRDLLQQWQRLAKRFGVASAAQPPPRGVLALRGIAVEFVPLLLNPSTRETPTAD